MYPYHVAIFVQEKSTQDGAENTTQDKLCLNKKPTFVKKEEEEEMTEKVVTVFCREKAFFVESNSAVFTLTISTW